jgi:hypothetical protein
VESQLRSRKPVLPGHVRPPGPRKPVLTTCAPLPVSPYLFLPFTRPACFATAPIAVVFNNGCFGFIFKSEWESAAACAEWHENAKEWQATEEMVVRERSHVMHTSYMHGASYARGRVTSPVSTSRTGQRLAGSSTSTRAPTRGKIRQYPRIESRQPHIYFSETLDAQLGVGLLDLCRCVSV